MRHLRTSVASVVVALLAACGGPSEPLGEPPSPAELKQIAIASYQSTRGRVPENLNVGQLHRVLVFAEREDYLLCVTTRERSAAAAFDNDGNQLAAAGAAFTQSSVILLREYSYGWGSGIYRNVENGKIGRVEISDYCPTSGRAW